MSDDAVIYAACQCGGERYAVPLQGRDLEAIRFTCPHCGLTEVFEAEQILAMKNHFGDAVGPISETLLAQLEAERLRSQQETGPTSQPR